MDFTVVYLAGRVLRHIGGILLLCWRRMVWAALITGGVGLLFAEIGGSSATHQIPAPIPAQIAAVLFAIGLAYGAAFTTLLAEIIIGALETIRLLEGEADAGARAAAIIGERAEGELSGFVGWIDAGAVALMTTLKGRSASTQHAISTQTVEKQGPSLASSRAASPIIPRKVPPTPAPIAQHPPLEFQRAAQSNSSYTQAAQSVPQGEIVTLNLETLAEIAATEEFVNTAPRPKVNARPVPANQLPRIEWAYEKLERQQDNEGSPASAPYIAPLELQIPPATSEEHQSQATPVQPLTPAIILPATGETLRPSPPPTRPIVTPPVSAENPLVPPTPIAEIERRAGRVTPPLPPDNSGAYWTPPPPVPVISRPSVERDASPRTTVPLAETAADRNGIWARISRALAGPPTHGDHAHGPTESAGASSSDRGNDA